MTRFTEEAERVLLSAGWSPHRRVDIAEWRRTLLSGGFRVHVAAETFLSEFGGLAVDIKGRGITAARTPFTLDPLLALGEDDRFNEWGAHIGSDLCPVGDLDGGRYFLGIGEDGVLYIVVDWLASLGPVPDGLERLILGIAADPVPDDDEPTGA